MSWDRPWRVDQWTARELNQFLAYSGTVGGPLVWQKESTVSFGEFHRLDWTVEIKDSKIYIISMHSCSSPDEARERAAVHAGFRKPFGVAPDGWRIAHTDVCRKLEEYQGYDSFMLSMRESVRFYGRLSDRQLKAYRRIAWKLK